MLVQKTIPVAPSVSNRQLTEADGSRAASPAANVGGPIHAHPESTKLG